MPGRVVIIGGANLDVRGVSAAPLVEETSNPGRVTLVPGGVARNIAEALARLGIATSLISVVGRDPAGDQLLAETAASGVDISGVMRSSDATGVYSAILNSDGNLALAVNAMDVMEGLTPEFIGAHCNLLASADFLIADCNLPAASLHWLVDFAAKAQSKFIIDPVSVPKCEKLLPALKAGSLFGLTPNRAQAERLTGLPCNSVDAAGEAARAIHGLGVQNVVLHLDRDGVLVSEVTSPGTTHGEFLPAKLMQPAPHDVTGGGDAAIAGFVFGLLNGRNCVGAARIGQIAAASVLDSPTGRLDAARVLSAIEL